MLRDKLMRGLTDIEETYVNGDLEQRVPHNLNVSFNFVEGESLIMAVKDIAVSSGSACTSAIARTFLCAARAGSFGRTGAQLDPLHHRPLHDGRGRLNYTVKTAARQTGKLRELSPLWEMHKDGVDLDTVGQHIDACIDTLKWKIALHPALKAGG
jgi:cysteine desulfurase